MDHFFQVIKELPVNRNQWTAVGIDGSLAGQKAVLEEGHIIYQSKEIPTEVQEFLKKNPKAGLADTEYGRIFVESLGAKQKLILCGGGHVSAATLSIGKMLGFYITVLEDRPEFARAAKTAGADLVICDEFFKGWEQLKTDSDTYVVIMTRGHRHDLDCLRQVLKKNYAYLGMMGSKSRVRKVKEQLQTEGFDETKIQDIYGPVGMPISAGTPAEIAVSVMGQIIQVKNQSKRREAYEREIARWLFASDDRMDEAAVTGEKQEHHVVLATIIARKGSAPRQIGTKMLIFMDGSSIGTIGGGCMEAEVKSQARHMLMTYDRVDQSIQSQDMRYKTCFVDMTALDAEEEGMVCGGTLEIFLEIL